MVKIHGLGHKSWQLFYFVDTCERITNVYVSCGMSAGIVSTYVVNTLSFRLYMSHFPTGLVSSKKKIVAMTFVPTYICAGSSAHSPTFTSLHLRYSSFSNPPIALPTSQLILQPFRCFIYVIAYSPTLLSLLLRHLHHLASRPWA